MPYDISTKRSAIRVQEDYVELRMSSLFASTAHGMLWMMSGMLHGLDHGASTLAADVDRTRVAMITKPFPVRTDRYEKSRDLQLLRMLEQGTPEDTWVRPNDAQVELRGKAFGNSMLGDDILTDAEGAELSYWALASLDVLPSGRLAFDPELFETNGDRLPERSAQTLRPILDVIGIERLAHTIGAFMSRDAVRVVPQETIDLRPNYVGSMPEDWVERFMISGVARRMLGDEQLPSYATQLGEVMRANYLPMASSDPDVQRLANERLVTLMRRARYGL
jgi:hypothetical protein